MMSRYAVLDRMLQAVCELSELSQVKFHFVSDETWRCALRIMLAVASGARRKGSAM
jgi:hypothetical protein